MNKKENEFDYSKIVEGRREIAHIIWDNSFMSGLLKLNKWQFIDIINLLVLRLDEFINVLQYSDEVEDYPNDERDAKDISFDCKCILIETLDEKFFNN